jgi:DNA-directed RNA polymerase subunit RPC12/RpoP
MEIRKDLTPPGGSKVYQCWSCNRKFTDEEIKMAEERLEDVIRPPYYKVDDLYEGD